MNRPIRALLCMAGGAIFAHALGFVASGSWNPAMWNDWLRFATIAGTAPALAILLWLYWGEQLAGRPQ